MVLFRRLLIRPGGVSGARVGAFPMEPIEYVFTAGVGSPYTVKYDEIPAVGPYTIASANDSFLATSVNPQRKLVRTSDGTLYDIYKRRIGNNYQVYVKQSIDEGVTWTDETAVGAGWVDAAHDSGYSALAVDSEDNLHAVWDAEATKQVYYSKYDGAWSGQVVISTGLPGMTTRHNQLPAIAVDSDDYLHVVWRGRTNVYPTNTQIWYKKYTTSWGTPTRISDYAGMENDYQSHPSIAIDSNDYVHVVWHGQATGYTTQDQIWYNKYTTSWAGPVWISTAAGMSSRLQSSPCIAVDSSDNLHVVWFGYATGFTGNLQIWYATAVPPHGAVNWVTPVRISNGVNMATVHQRAPSICVGSDDYLHVIWQSADTKIWYSLYTISWAIPVELQTGLSISEQPSLRWSRWPR